jgi:hypothetical protein
MYVVEIVLRFLMNLFLGLFANTVYVDPPPLPPLPPPYS